ncbi:hypothetical protein PBY51_015767 [Eleginops maclovinus]|uniref:Uncharacterized protein n=1 Tax=Eleginops maclovinus TaxID=56733 RepID=A0AAN7XLY3_ELEMC|nr:hypothetical protein PBY51_015767 [Eleginops maclovinus]
MKHGNGGLLALRCQRRTSLPCLSLLPENRSQCGDKGDWSSSEGVDSVLATPSALWVWHFAQVENGRGGVGNHEGVGPVLPAQKRAQPTTMGPLTSLSCVVS